MVTLSKAFTRFEPSMLTPINVDDEATSSYKGNNPCPQRITKIQFHKQLIHKATRNRIISFFQVNLTRYGGNIIS